MTTRWPGGRRAARGDRPGASGSLSCSSVVLDRNPFQRRPGRGARAGRSAQPLRAAAADQARAGRRPGAPPSVRHEPHLSAGSLHAALPDQRHHRPSPPRPRDGRGLGLVAEALRLHDAAAGLDSSDRVALAFSFGPHVQFWAAKEGLQEVGAMGGLAGRAWARCRGCRRSPRSRRRPLVHPDLRAAPARGGGGAAPRVRPRIACERVLCTGEPGGSLPGVRSRIEEGFGRGLHRPRRPHGGGAVRRSVRRGSRAAHRRERVRLRDPRRRT